MKKILAIASITLLLLGCGKPEEIVYQTVEPLPYLPVYPGSWWVYDLNGEDVVWSVETDYLLHTYESKQHLGKKTEPTYVPVWEGEAVYGYSSPGIFYDLEQDEPCEDCEVQIPYLSENLGERFELSNAPLFYTYRQAMSREQSFLLDTTYYTDVLVVNDYMQFKNAEPPILIKSAYYARNIGLIGYDEFTNGGTEKIPNIRLREYSIKK